MNYPELFPKSFRALRPLTKISIHNYKMLKIGENYTVFPFISISTFFKGFYVSLLLEIVTVYLPFCNVASSEGYLGPMSVSTRIEIITNQVVVIVFFCVCGIVLIHF